MGNPPFEVRPQGVLVQLKLKDSPQWLGGRSGLAPEEQMVTLDWDTARSAVSVRNVWASYLTCEGEHAFFTARTDVTVSELWRHHLGPDGTVVLLSLSSGKRLRTGERTLLCDAESDAEAARWEQRTATQDRVILFGTLKPLKQLGPANASDMYDSFIIAKRTLTNWAKLPGVKPVVFATDVLNHRLIEHINAAHEKMPGTSRIDIISNFEMHETFGQPTYRGLFQKVIATYPSARAIMYSNMDILFTSSLMNTVSAVRRLYERKNRAEPSLRGWFIVGRRVNVTVPPSWSMDEHRWESRMKDELLPTGLLHGMYGEDYFIMNPELFNWKAIPPFVVGGVVFDNWLTSRGVNMSKRNEVLTVDATRTLTAIHQNHASTAYLSHKQPKSEYNIRLMKRNGGTTRYGSTMQCPYLTVRRRGEIPIIVARRRKRKVA